MMQTPSAVLDLDLDFFAAAISERAHETEADLPELWSREDAKRFLEEQCGLSTDSRIPGRIITSHYHVVDLWLDLQLKYGLIAPFDIYHVDAHADLAQDFFNGAPQLYGFVSQSLLPLPLDDRLSSAATRGMNETNFLIFAGAAELVSRLVYVTHRDWRDGDLPWHFVTRGAAHRAEAIVLAQHEAEVWDRRHEYLDPLGNRTPRDIPAIREIIIPLTVVPAEVFRAERPFAAASLSRSPGYARQNRSDLIDLFAQYIQAV